MENLAVSGSHIIEFHNDIRTKHCPSHLSAHSCALDSHRLCYAATHFCFCFDFSCNPIPLLYSSNHKMLCNPCILFAVDFRGVLTLKKVPARFLSFCMFIISFPYLFQSQFFSTMFSWIRVVTFTSLDHSSRQQSLVIAAHE